MWSHRLLSTFGLTLLASSPRQIRYVNGSEVQLRRRLSSRAAQGGSCSGSVTEPAVEKEVHIPTWLSAFPGSGSTLTWQLIQAITGIVTDEESIPQGPKSRRTAVAVKTQFPGMTSVDVFDDLQRQLRIQNAILILRNPYYAISSYFNYLYELEHQLPPQTTLAPVEAWIQWRDAHFFDQLSQWVTHIKWWIENYSTVSSYTKSNDQQRRLHFVWYETLTKPETGTDELILLGFFLRELDPVVTNSMVPFKTFDCIWSVYTRLKSPRRRQGPNDYPYTAHQMEMLNRVFSRLRNSYGKKLPLVGKIMQSYMDEIRSIQLGVGAVSY